MTPGFLADELVFAVLVERLGNSSLALSVHAHRGEEPVLIARLVIVTTSLDRAPRDPDPGRPASRPRTLPGALPMTGEGKPTVLQPAGLAGAARLRQRHDGRRAHPRDRRRRRLGRRRQFPGRLRRPGPADAPEHPRHPGRGRRRAAPPRAPHLVCARRRRIRREPARARPRLPRDRRRALPGDGGSRRSCASSKRRRASRSRRRRSCRGEHLSPQGGERPSCEATG